MNNVFGQPITDEAVKKLAPEYFDLKKVTKRDRARAAMLLKDHGGKDMQARKFLEDYKRNFGGSYIMCLLYNATGDPVYFTAYRHWFAGNRVAIPYPMIVQNGQWAAFLHLTIGSNDETLGYSYKGKNENGETIDFGYVFGAHEGGRVYTEIREAGYFTFSNNCWDFGTMHSLNRRVHETHGRGCASFLTVGQGGNGMLCVEALMTLQDAWLL